MRKKIFDIVSLDKQKKVFTSKKEKRKKILKFPKFLFLPIFFASIFVGTFLFFNNWAKVELQIWPKIETKNYEEKIIVETNLKTIDFDKNKVPGEIFEIEKEIEKTFPATGKTLKKAEGKIRLYNQYTTQEERWVAGTRFVSNEGKIFLSKNSFIVPGAKIKEGKLEPSFVDVEVVAMEPGEDYNIGPSKFSILAFKGTERFFKYWGESFEPMRGGGEVVIVTEEDLENSLNFFKKEIENDKGKEFLKREIPENKIFPENGIAVEILEKEFSAKAGDEVEKFNLKVKAKIKTVLLNKKDLQSFLEERFYQEIGPNKKILKTTEKISLTASVVNFESGNFLISLKSAVKTLPKIEKTIIKKEIAGKRIVEAKNILSNLKEVEKVKVNVFPFWMAKVPENLERIEVFIFEGS